MTRESLREDDRFLHDGMYAVADDIVVKELERDPFDTARTPKLDEIVVFADQYPDFVIANAYETFTCLLLSRRPDPFQGLVLGTEFNYGATALIENAPKRLLILAQND